jgi:uncharacterized protein (DUF39 family)
MANVVPSLPILVTLVMKELRSSETLVLTRATRSNIPEATFFNTNNLFAQYMATTEKELKHRRTYGTRH